MTQPDTSPELRDFERHRHITDKRFRQVLKRIGKGTGRKYPETLNDFRGQDYDITLAFWVAIEKVQPGKFNQVEYCHGCRAVHLWLDPSIKDLNDYAKS
ncbi:MULTISPECIES: hypothetical protein [unclassified Pseudomonas]|uniref:hypothetical protein n=1 Tax=unclassified Pseudomonas TaxID=196821 RepID=UPI0025EAAC1C|nr:MULTISPECIES: hypothetical protein [unclassified Pseudomonas]